MLEYMNTQGEREYGIRSVWMVEKQISHFDLRQIADSGQCFRMKLLSRNIPADGSSVEAYDGSRLAGSGNCFLEPVRYAVTASDRYVEVEQEGDWFRFFCGEREFREFWSDYFDLETDYGQFIARIGKRDRYLQQAAAFGGGIRILKQDLWEVMVTFLISQNNHMKRIRQCVERLCENFGEKRETAEGKCYYGMPGPEAFADLGALRDMGLGYRDKYIAALGAAVAEGSVDLGRLRSLKGKEKVHKELTAIYGIGDKVANCIQLFGLHQIDAFPVDTWIKKVLEQHYPKGFPMRRYKGCAGVMQQYMFYYESHRLS